MDTFDNQNGLKIEHRRPGLWIVQCCARFFSVELGQDRVTFESYYRVTSGKCVTHFPTIAAVIEFCTLSSGPSAAAR